MALRVVYRADVLQRVQQAAIFAPQRLFVVSQRPTLCNAPRTKRSFAAGVG